MTLLIVYLYWRYFFFFRDPERHCHDLDGIISPADGTVVYITRVRRGLTPISVKRKREIRLEEIIKTNVLDESKVYYHIGIFMHPTSVHVNRAPISGQVKDIKYSAGTNLPMTITWWRVLLRRRSFEKYAGHLFENERNTILIDGKIPVWVTQIADVYVKKIECWVKLGEMVGRGQRLGMIKMGSQVDMVFPATENMTINIAVGQKVTAGETVIASEADYIQPHIDRPEEKIANMIHHR